MSLRIVTWNINSVRLRVDQIARFVAEYAPDVLCLQEIKCTEDQFPREAFEQMGLPYLKIRGQKGWHGVAIASRLPILDGEGAALDLIGLRPEQPGLLSVTGHAFATQIVEMGCERRVSTRFACTLARRPRPNCERLPGVIRPERETRPPAFCAAASA